VTLSEVLDEFGGHRLLSYDRDPVNGYATVEVAHDALLTEWPRLAGWLDHYRDDLRRRAALGIAVEDWERSGRQDDYLFTGGRLAEYEEWSNDSDLQLTAQEREFLGASVQRRNAELIKEAGHRDEQRRLERRARTRLVALFVAVILLAGAATVGVFAWLRNRPPEAVAVLPAGGGVFAAMVDRGFSEGIAESGVRGDISIVSDDEAVDEIAAVSDRGVELVVSLEDCGDVDSVAAAHPDTQYLAFDCLGAIGDLPNVTYASFATEQGSFLAGAAAALKSETGVIGFVGGVEFSMIEQFRAGYEAGARAADPGIDIRSEYLTQPPDNSGSDNETLGFQAAERLYRGGADIVFHAAGVSGYGVFEAATQLSPELGRQLWVIGVDTDQSRELSAGDPWKPHILTSMRKRYDDAVSVVVEEYSRGALTAGEREFDLAAGGLDLALSGGFIDDIRPRLEQLRSQIVAGEIEVPSSPSAPVAAGGEP
jgi:basic membrane lipoprotein Med (substrate-binding protein (PBP1-ABC) superfamily)